ncbi:hypothetical protein OIU79_026419 [Salix purpurea]|uniref:Uncharacterized protein n=1 Tax=Salix purpurea TaxID=77065 RepID=A0A9Q1A0P8_SALPP|nr:hypothetical protein OIU79_026419 [Salix purpurea]
MDLMIKPFAPRRNVSKSRHRKQQKLKKRREGRGKHVKTATLPALITLLGSSVRKWKSTNKEERQASLADW